MLYVWMDGGAGGRGADPTAIVVRAVPCRGVVCPLQIDERDSLLVLVVGNFWDWSLLSLSKLELAGLSSYRLPIIQPIL